MLQRYLAHPDFRAPTLALLATLALALSLAAMPCLADERQGATQLTGRPLDEALRELQSRGLDLFFTNRTVSPDLRVVAEPVGRDLREILDEILAPHGLVAELGPGGRLVVVRGIPKPATLTGIVRARDGGIALAGAKVRVLGADREIRTGDDGRFVLAELAAGVHSLEVGLPGFVVQRRKQVSAPPGRTVELVFELVAAPLALDEILVTPSRISLLRNDPITSVALDQDDIFALPHYGDDLFRAMSLLPGVAGEEVSARFNVRGGRADEVLVLLDRVELFEPYHLKDFSSAVSIVTPRALGEVNLITGGFPAEYGDRMSGVLDMTTTLPDRRHFLLGLGVLNAEVHGSGTFGDAAEDGSGGDGGDGVGDGHWLASLRRGSLDLALKVLGQTEKPRYWDLFGKLERRIRPGQDLSLNVLHSDDSLDQFIVEEDAEELYHTSYGNSYLWLGHRALFGKKLFVDSVVSVGRVERDRQGTEKVFDGEEGDGFTLRDKRRLDALGLKQDWSVLIGTKHYLKWGVDLRRLETDYDYVNDRVLEDPLADVRSEPRTGTTLFRETLRGDQRGVYLSDRTRLGEGLTLEFGLRYDEQTLTADRHLSPRINLVWAVGGSSVLRAAWGLFFQSQRPYELQVEDGETALVSAERTEQRVLGFEHNFVGVGKSGLQLRVEAYQREIRNPRVRFESLYEPISVFPEIEADRFRVAPERGEAYGLEIFLRGSIHPRIEWWASYAYARVFDRIDGRDQPRRIDQPHTFNFDLNFQLGPHWDLNLAWRYHTGWPTTAFSGKLEENDDGELEFFPVFGPINGERLPTYHRLDLRLSREWRKKRGTLGFFLEVQNVYDRGNIAGSDVDFEFNLNENGEVDVFAVKEIWGGILPSFGVTWEL